jgi:transcriptional regulator with XRE-family HTH domain
MTTAEYLKKLRLSLCLSQREFARVLNIHHSAFSHYERGDRKPSFKTIRKIMTFAQEQGINIKLKDIRNDYAKNGKADNEA